MSFSQEANKKVNSTTNSEVDLMSTSTPVLGIMKTEIMSKSMSERMPELKSTTVAEEKAEGTVFFFPRKSLQGTHLLVLRFFLFFLSGLFFFRPFFFWGKSLQATHSTEKIEPAKKAQKKGKKMVFFVDF